MNKNSCPYVLCPLFKMCVCVFEEKNRNKDCFLYDSYLDMIQNIKNNDEYKRIMEENNDS